MRTLFISLLMLVALLTAAPALAVDTGVSCTTPWGNKVIADGQSISYEPYFTRGVKVGAIVVPMMRCSNGTWLTCDYLGNNCAQNGLLIPTAPNPAPTTPPATFLPPGGITICPLIYAPVCGTNGKTYGSTCNATAAKVPVAHVGPCSNAPASTEPPLFKIAPRAPQASTTVRTTVTTNTSVERARTSIKRSISFLEAAVVRGEGLAARITSRMSKSTGDLTIAQNAITEATAELQAARTLLVELKAGIDVGTGTNAVDAFGTAKEVVHNVNTHITKAMNALSKSLRAIPYIY